MTNEILEVESSSRDGLEIVRVRGEVDIASAPILWLEVEQAIARGDGIVIDLSEVSFLDSTGLGVLVSARNAVEQADRLISFDLVVSSPHLHKLLDITGLTPLFRIHPTLSAACER